MNKKTIFLILILICISSFTFAQNSIEYYQVLKAGTAKLTDGACKIELDQSVNPYDDYYVVITPVGDFIELYIDFKAKEYFSVKSKSIQTGTFDFLIYVKRQKPIPSNQKNKG